MEDKVGLKRILSLFAISAKMDLAWLMRDTKYALAGITADIISNISMVSGAYLIALRFDGVGGLTANEVLFMMAYSTIVTGLFLLFASGNNIHISRIIGRGQLEHLFIQPLPLKIQLFTCGFSPFTGGGNFVVGIAILIFSVKLLGITVTFNWVAMLVLYLLATMVIIVARSYLVSSSAFYAPTACEEISSTAIDGTWFLSTFPLSGMPLYIQIPLISVLPEGLMAWFPALCLIGKPPIGFGAPYPFLYALLIFITAKYVFKKGLKYYVKKGSNRYVPYGFRR